MLWPIRTKNRHKGLPLNAPVFPVSYLLSGRFRLKVDFHIIRFMTNWMSNVVEPDEIISAHSMLFVEYILY